MFQYPENLGNQLFLVSWYPGNIGNLFSLVSCHSASLGNLHCRFFWHPGDIENLPRSIFCGRGSSRCSTISPRMASAEAGCSDSNKSFSEAKKNDVPRGTSSEVLHIRIDQALGAQTEHQPLAATALPGKIWHGRQASPSAP